MRAVVGWALIVSGFVVGFVLTVIGLIVRSCENDPCARFPGWIGPVVGIAIIAAGVLAIPNRPRSERDHRRDDRDGDAASV
jgi:hypothetical protein